MPGEILTGYAEIIDVIENLPLIVREARRARGISLRQASEEIGISFSTLSRFEGRTEKVVGIQLEPVLLILDWLDQTEPMEVPDDQR